jgi:16S rRNA (cytosine1402-N4)-methyltransferase
LTNNKYHIPVLLNESLDNLVYDPKGVYVDATFGGGGHSIFLLNKLHPEGRVLAFDQDKDSIKNNCINDPRLNLFNINFRYIYNILNKLNVYEISGLIADLGISYHQLVGRGLSTKLNNELDMRINDSTDKYAKIIVNTYSEERLANILFKYGELKNASKIAQHIIRYRKKSIETTFDLINILTKIVPNKIFAQVFQSIRIEVNDEINALKDLLIHSYNILKNKGRIVIISYHSIEDRIIKKFLNYNYYFKMIYKKNFKPNKKEIIINPRARSAKMRMAVKII